MPNFAFCFAVDFNSSRIQDKESNSPACDHVQILNLEKQPTRLTIYLPFLRNLRGEVETPAAASISEVTPEEPAEDAP